MRGRAASEAFPRLAQPRGRRTGDLQLPSARPYPITAYRLSVSASSVLTFGMPRRVQFLWISVLASLIAGPVGTRSFGALGRAEAVPVGESIDSAPPYTVPIARSVLAIQAGPQSHRPVGPSFAAVPGDLQAHALEQRLLAVPVLSGRDTLGRTARHFPLFPTGPPADS